MTWVGLQVIVCLVCPTDLSCFSYGVLLCFCFRVLTKKCILCIQRIMSANSLCHCKDIKGRESGENKRTNKQITNHRQNSSHLQMSGIKFCLFNLQVLLSQHALGRNDSTLQLESSRAQTTPGLIWPICPASGSSRPRKTPICL